MNRELLLKVLIVAAIVAAGLFVFNLVIDWSYKAQLLMSPCQLCTQINPEVAKCWEMKPHLTNLTEQLLDFNP